MGYKGRDDDWETRKQSEAVISNISAGKPEGYGPPPVPDYADKATESDDED